MLTPENFSNLTGRIIALRPEYVRMVGDFTVAVMLTQFIYCQNNNKGKWFEVSMDEIEQEWCLSKYQQRRARNRLKTMGLLKEMQKPGFDRTMRYQLDIPAFCEKFNENARSRNLTMDHEGTLPLDGQETVPWEGKETSPSTIKHKRIKKERELLPKEPPNLQVMKALNIAHKALDFTTHKRLVTWVRENPPLSTEAICDIIARIIENPAKLQEIV